MKKAQTKIWAFFVVWPSGGMVDTQDLKSCVHYGRAGSTPASATRNLSDRRL